MSIINSAVAVLTSRSKDEIIKRGGTGNWAASPERIIQNRYVVAIRNQRENALLHQNDFGHGAAFLVGRISGIAETDERAADGRMRYVIEFDSYAEVDVPAAWGKSRNPVWFTTLDELGINFDNIEFTSLAEGTRVQPAGITAPGTCNGLTFAEARRGLAAHYGVAPSNVEIVIRG